MNISLDIDGVISDYPVYFLEFLRREGFGNYHSIKHARLFLGEGYELAKFHYRSSDYKYIIPIREYVKDFTELAYLDNHKVFIHTSRPLNSLEGIKSKTENWLRFSGVFFESLDLKTSDNLKKNCVSLHIDDDLGTIMRMKSMCIGIRFFWMSRKRDFKCKTKQANLYDLLKLNNHL